MNPSPEDADDPALWKSDETFQPWTLETDFTTPASADALVRWLDEADLTLP